MLRAASAAAAAAPRRTRSRPFRPQQPPCLWPPTSAAAPPARPATARAGRARPSSRRRCGAGAALRAPVCVRVGGCVIDNESAERRRPREASSAGSTAHHPTQYAHTLRRARAHTNNTQRQRSARLAYSFLFLLAMLVAWAMRDFARPLIERIPCETAPPRFACRVAAPRRFLPAFRPPLPFPPLLLYVWDCVGAAGLPRLRH